MSKISKNVEVAALKLVASLELPVKRFSKEEEKEVEINGCAWMQTIIIRQCVRQIDWMLDSQMNGTFDRKTGRLMYDGLVQMEDEYAAMRRSVGGQRGATVEECAAKLDEIDDQKAKIALLWDHRAGFVAAYEAQTGKNWPDRAPAQRGGTIPGQAPQRDIEAQLAALDARAAAQA